MTRKPIIENCLDLSIPIFKIHINGIEIPNTLIDLGATINIMRKNTMDQLRLTNLQYTPTFLQLVVRSTIKPYGILEYLSVSLDSCQYHVEFYDINSQK